MKKNSEKFFQNTDCKYFPCHKNVSEESFNCLFCYCPLYLLGKECGGNFVYLPNGIKSCENCGVPHEINGYERVTGKIERIAEEARKINNVAE